MSISAKVGDVFLVPLDSQTNGVGVVAAKWKEELYLVLFAERIESAMSHSSIDIDRLTPYLASSSLDAKIWHGHWPVVQSGVNVSALIQPFYKVEERSGWVLESFDRKIRRNITAINSQSLDYRKTVAPVRLESALKASFKLAEWDPIYEELKYERISESELKGRALIK